MIDQLIIGGVGSYDKFEANVKERTIKSPKKKSITETVPFSNITYDYSSMNGETYWEQRELEYVFEITADSPEELEVKKQPFVAWIMNVEDEEIHDPFIRDYHFKGTFEDIDPDDSEIEKSTITVTFKAYPYKIANKKRIIPVNITTNEITVKVPNLSNHRIVPTFKSDVEFALKMGASSFGLPVGEITSDSIMFNPGTNTVKLATVTGTGTVMIEFYEEVL